MRPRRVGVVSGDDRLFVDLALRGGDLDLARVDAREPGEQDVVLLDVPPGGDATATAAAVPEGPAVVVLAEDAIAPAGTTLVRRPCTVEELLEVLRTATPLLRPATDQPVDAPEVVIVVDEPEPATSAPLFGPAPSSPSDTVPVPAPTSASLPATARPTDPTAPAPLTEALARQLAESLGRTGSEQQAADTAAALLLLAYAAEHVALWRRQGGHYVVLGSAGLSDGAQRMELSEDHPVVQMTQARDGTLVHDEAEEGSWAPGLPGSRAPVYVMVDTAAQAGPVDLVTASGRRLGEATAAQLHVLVGRLGGAWPSAAGAPTS